MAAPQKNRVEARDVGPHRIELEFPDLVHIHYGGDVELAHFLGFNEFMEALPPLIPLYLLRDARAGGLVTPETRKHIATGATPSRFVAIATYGSSFQTKTVFSNMNRAMRTMRPHEVPVEFFDTESEARARIAEHREASGDAAPECSPRV